MSIPTSLILVLLVAAWLVVLVPMIARRRQPVPEAETTGGTFRILRRGSGPIRRRLAFRRHGFSERNDDPEDAGLDRISTKDHLDDELMDDDDEYDNEIDGADYQDEPVVAHDESRRSTALSGRSSGSHPYRPASEYPIPDPRTDIDEERLRPIPLRPGRGGYDPEAAEVARAYKYSRRRRVAVTLLLGAIVFSVAAWFLLPILWIGTAVFGLLLVAYLVYLRRQVRIEADIRARRLARLRRARQIRPEYDLDSRGPASGSSPGAAAARSLTPPSGYRRGREVVDLEDDDPSFDDLDYYQPLQYRRASGQ